MIFYKKILNRSVGKKTHYDVKEYYPTLLSEFLVDSFLVFFILLFSIWVVTAHIAGITGITFRSLCLFYTVLSLTTIYIMLKNFIEKFAAVKKNISGDDLHAVLMLIALVIIASAISIIFIRPDLDDVNYSSYAVYFLNNSSNAIDFGMYDLWLPGSLPKMPQINISNTITLYCAYIAYVFNIQFLHVYHIILPALTGAMIPLGWFLVFAKFSKKGTTAAIASTMICVFLSLDGDPHRTFGNFAFVRIWQGKAILMSVLFPIFIAFTIDFFRYPSLRNLSKIVALNCSAAGLSITAVFFIPIAGFLIGSAYLFKNKDFIDKQKIKKIVFLYMSSYCYLFIVAGYLMILAYTNSKLFEYVGTNGWPDNFLGQFRFVFMNYQFYLFIIFFVLSLYLSNNENRKFLLFWVFLLGILLLNPIVFPYISKYITTLNTYWRLFYLLPFPFVIGLPVVYLKFQESSRKRFWWISFILLITIAIIGNISDFKHATFSKLSLGFGQHKVDKQLEKDIRFIIKLCKPGPMLAPLKYSSIIPIYTADYPQVVVRKFSLIGYARQHDLLEMANRRFSAENIVSGRSTQGIEHIGYLINEGLRNIVIDLQKSRAENWLFFNEYLKNKNFRCIGGNDRLRVYAKGE